MPARPADPSSALHFQPHALQSELSGPHPTTCIPGMALAAAADSIGERVSDALRPPLERLYSDWPEITRYPTPPLLLLLGTATDARQYTAEPSAPTARATEAIISCDRACAIPFGQILRRNSMALYRRLVVLFPLPLLPCTALHFASAETGRNGHGARQWGSEPRRRRGARLRARWERGESLRAV